MSVQLKPENKQDLKDQVALVRAPSRATVYIHM